MYHLPVSTHICIITYRISTNPSVSSPFFKNIQDSLAKSLSFTFWLLYNLQILKRLLANLTSIRYFNNIWNILYFLLYSETMKEDSCAIQGSFTKDYQAFYLSSSSPFFFFFLHNDSEEDFVFSISKVTAVILYVNCSYVLLLASHSTQQHHKLHGVVEAVN